MSEDMRQRIAGSELVTLSGARHQLAIERADAVNAHLMAFLARYGGAADFDRGLAVRTSVLGADYVDAALRSAGDFGAPWQDFITRYAWGEIWGDPTLPRKTRSLITLAMMVALHREEEFKMHVRPALGNGVSVEEMRAMVKQAAVYAGVPAGNAAIRWMREVFGEEL
jgi:3-oxoadipate enol-lactonase/4-carboxymuconolactone decarboxylase